MIYRCSLCKTDFVAGPLDPRKLLCPACTEKPVPADVSVHAKVSDYDDFHNYDGF